MNAPDRPDPTWDTAWDWVIREHEQALGDAELSQLVAWLRADPAHRRAYDEACSIWLAAGLLPPVAADRSDEAPECRDPNLPDDAER